MRNAEKEQNELDELYGEVVHGIAEKGAGQIKGEDRLKGQGTTVDYKGSCVSISELHEGIRYPLLTLGIWCPSELHGGIRHPLLILCMWYPMQ